MTDTQSCAVAAAFKKQMKSERGAAISRAMIERRVTDGPDAVRRGIALEAIVGSRAYGAAQEGSDTDVYGFCIPWKTEIFANMRGEIPGFGPAPKPFETWQRQGVEFGLQPWDITIWSITKLFNMALEGQPNALAVLYAPEDCIKFQNAAGGLVLRHRDLFLAKSCAPKFRGFSKGAQKEMSTGENYKPKQACHAVRLLMELNQMLSDGVIDRRQGAATYRAIRTQEMAEADVRALLAEQEALTERLLIESTLRDAPDLAKIKAVLVAALRDTWGDTSNCLYLREEEEALVGAVLKGEKI